MSANQNILITGASGFIGKALTMTLANKKNTTISTLSLKQKNTHTATADSNTKKLESIDTVIHLAGRAHILKETNDNPLTLYRADNVEKTLELAKQAISSGVRRFIFVSSIGVNGSTTRDLPFNELSPTTPRAHYAISKLEAELGLKELLHGSPTELVVIRPPLVYAGHAPGNFERLIKLVNTGLPLPFALVNNSRSMIALENLVDFIICCIDHPQAANETFLISDGTEISTAQIIKYLAKGLNRTPRLLPIPLPLIKISANLLGVKGIYEQLFCSLIIDSSKARNKLQWQPITSPEEAICKAGKDYKSSHKKN
ncbi:NAD-dependent epimerase [Pseudomonas protegens]|uniref:NAD-dependent epimerase n=1 Tax=Pseudomonas protegens TaxID=380021 RepID=A0A2T6GIE7_9PSED|nr:NAD-dependent epimerase/dehydratase family protein [Pseudomonas protegens]PUA43915.1 NAD-dependent epimerase [Pseudomonas protegens]